MFKMKYRAVTGSIEGYFVIQRRKWWFSTWVSVDVAQGLNNAIARIDKLKKVGTVVYEED